MASSIARILIVEDDSSITLLSTKVLERLGYAIVGIAASGDEAIQQAQQTHPDLALVDIKLRGAKDGIETAAQLRAFLDLAVVYLTSYTDEETLRRAKETEPDGYLVKPILEINLQVGVEMALHRHKMQQNLRDSEEKWRAVIEQSQDGIVLIDSQGQVIEWNQAQEQITGLARAEVLGRPLWDVQYQVAPAERRRIPDLYEQIKARYEEFFTVGSASWLNRSLEHGIERPDGTRRFVQTTPFAIETSQGVMVAGVTRDITASKQAEMQLYAAERFTRATIDALSAHICVLDETGVILAVNRAWREFAQANPPIPANCCEGANYLAVCDTASGPDAAEAAPFAAGIRTVMRGELEQFSLEYPCPSAEEPRWFIGRVTRFLGNGSLRLVVAHENITTRKQTEETLRASEERHRLLIENMPAGVVVHAPDTSILLSNHKARELLGLTEMQLLGKTAADPGWHFIREDKTSMPLAEYPVNRVLETLKPLENVVIGIRQPNGDNLIWVMVNAYPVYSEEKALDHITVIFIDITERKQAEQLLSQRAAQLAIINDIGRHVAAELNVNKVLEQATRLVQEKFDYHHVALFLIERDALKLKAVAGAYAAYFPPGHTQQLDQGLNGWVATHGEKIVANDVRTEARYISLIAEHTTTRAELTLPIKIGPDTVGVLDIQSQHLNAFANNDVLAMETLTAQIAVAMVNSQLYEAAQQELADRQRAEEALQDNLQRAKIAYNQATIYAQELTQEVNERKQVQAALATERTFLAQRVEERTAELSAAIAELERAARLKDEFLANMSHELRTPLNSILGMAEILKENVYGDLNSEQQQSVGYIEESGNHLLALITDILDMAKIEAGKTELLIAPVVAQDVCQASLLFVKQTAQKKQINVSTAFDPAVDVVQTDERRLKQILVNLLSNAVKFTPEGGQIGLEVTGDKAAGVVRFVVWDTGIGIARQDMSRLFQPFEQLDNRLSRQYEGTGLGLVLVYRLVELHGGSVTVESEGKDKGSRFTVSLPWGVSDNGLTTAPLSLQPEPATVSDQPSAVVLLVEDNDANVATIQTFVQAKGYQVLTARSGIEALERIWEERPDIILMDIQMPGMDGLEVIQHLRADATLNHIPVIALTALAMPGDRERCLAAGANEYLSKPVSLKKLTQLIAKLVKE